MLRDNLFCRQERTYFSMDIETFKRTFFPGYYQVEAEAPSDKDEPEVNSE